MVHIWAANEQNIAIGSIYYHLFLLCEYYTWTWFMNVDQNFWIKFHCFSSVTGNKIAKIVAALYTSTSICVFFLFLCTKFCLGVILNDFCLFENRKKMKKSTIIYINVRPWCDWLDNKSVVIFKFNYSWRVHRSIHKLLYAFVLCVNYIVYK